GAARVVLPGDQHRRLRGAGLPGRGAAHRNAGPHRGAGHRDLADARPGRTGVTAGGGGPMTRAFTQVVADIADVYPLGLFGIILTLLLLALILGLVLQPRGLFRLRLRRKT